MTALIARLEAATEGSRELDAEIFRIAKPEFADMQLHPNAPGWIMGGDHKQPECAPDYTTSIDAALPGEEIHRVERVQSPTVTWWKAYQGIHIGQGKTEALARRIAALKARSAP